MKNMINNIKGLSMIRLNDSLFLINLDENLKLNTTIMERREDNIRFKILLIDPSGISSIIKGVGKSSLLLKYVHNKFPMISRSQQAYSTIQNRCR